MPVTQPLANRATPTMQNAMSQMSHRRSLHTASPVCCLVLIRRFKRGTSPPARMRPVADRNKCTGRRCVSVKAHLTAPGKSSSNLEKLVQHDGRRSRQERRLVCCSLRADNCQVAAVSTASRRVASLLQPSIQVFNMFLSAARQSRSNPNIPVQVIHGCPPPAVDMLILVPRAKQANTQTRVPFKSRLVPRVRLLLALPDFVQRDSGRSWSW